jgi:hypothetical protein
MTAKWADASVSPSLFSDDERDDDDDDGAAAAPLENAKATAPVDPNGCTTLANYLRHRYPQLQVTAPTPATGGGMVVVTTVVPPMHFDHLTPLVYEVGVLYGAMAAVAFEPVANDWVIRFTHEDRPVRINQPDWPPPSPTAPLSHGMNLMVVIIFVIQICMLCMWSSGRVVITIS